MSNCIICISDFNDDKPMIKLKCNHEFHYDCISKIKNNLCPLCRDKITDEELCYGNHSTLFYVGFYYKNGKCRICSKKNIKYYLDKMSRH
jgi:hypothetical protein